MHQYSLFNYGNMMSDRVRMGAYCAALEKSIKPGDVVVDLGSGTGILTLHACRLGAATVHAIEPNAAIETMREVVAANGFKDRVVFHRVMSKDFELPSGCDVLVADLHGVLPLYEKGIQTMVDARRRLLKPGGVIIPGSDQLKLALIESPEDYGRHDNPWRRHNDGFDFEAVRRRMIQEPSPVRLEPSQLLSDGALWAVLDYNRIDYATVGGSVDVTARRDGVAHGFTVWFDSELVPGVSTSNAPGQPRMIYGQNFFPFTESVPVKAGNTVSIDLQACPVGGDYIWRWDSGITGEAGETKRALFRQSTFSGMPVSLEELHRRSDAHVPALSDEGHVQRRTLELMAESCPLGDIARRLMSEFPGRFARWEDALQFAGDLSVRFSR